MLIFKCYTCGHTVEIPKDYYQSNKERFYKMYCGDCLNTLGINLMLDHRVNIPKDAPKMRLVGAN